jgi:nucleoside-diphosphate-sugar epimerase
MAPPAGRVLLTGANGFVATHILKGLIDLNYHIVGTVRSIKKGEDVIAIHPEWKDSITWIKIENIGSPNAYDEAFKLGPYDYIIHNASPVDFTVTEFQRDMIDPAVKGYDFSLEPF